MHRLRTVTLLDVSAVAGHHAMPAALLLFGMFALLSVVKSDDVYFLIPFFSRSPVQLGVPS